MEDSPVHYNVDHYVESADALVSEGLPEPVSWGQDDEGAYRKLHATPANVMYFILVTHMGATLCRHRVAMFGARGAVWAHNRLADAVMHIARVYLALWRGTTSTTRARLTRARSHRADLTRTSACANYCAYA